MKQKTKVKQSQKQTQNIEQVIDEALQLDLEIKEKTALLKKKKAELRRFAINAGLKKLAGNQGKVVFSDEVKTSIEPFKLFSLLQDLDMDVAFFDLVKVNITEAKKKVGDVYLEGIKSEGLIEYAKMKLSKK